MAQFADRPSVGATSATLPRGTLVSARLTRSIDVVLPGPVEAVVTEDVVANGALMVSKGSTIVCTSRRSSDGRVPLSCDTIRTVDRQLIFQGVAVGEGQHLGLRALDNEIAAGTAFVVYVNASAAIQ
jgi:serine/threonine-protein kinase